MTDSAAILLDSLLQPTSGLSLAQRKRIADFYEVVCRENRLQNLTRLTSPTDFYEGHILDVLELLRQDWMRFPAIDLGSGVGVPGLLAALLREDRWTLVESEKRKADYLKRAVSHLGLESQVQVDSRRIEDFLKSNAAAASAKFESIVVRAVGPVARIYSWLRKSSTWNSLVLLKGPSWDSEWEDFQKGTYRNELRVQNDHRYCVGSEAKIRRIIHLARVPRGTSK